MSAVSIIAMKIVGIGLQQLGIVVLARAAAAGEADRLDAAGHHHIGAVIGDVARGHGDRLQARGAEAVDGDAGGGDRQAGQQRGVAPRLPGAVRHIADEAILDRFLFDPGALDRVLHRVRRHGDGGGDVETAAARLGQPSAGIGNDDGFTH
jgi:hypothetical protein